MQHSKVVKKKRVVLETHSFRFAYESITEKTKPEPRKLEEPKNRLPQKIDIYV
jgi:hypothetical protein